VIPVRDVLGLYGAKRFQERARQRGIVLANAALCNTELLMRNMLGTTRNVLFGFREMSKPHAAISSALGGSAVDLSATDA
jgi:hypothetical protein